MPHSLWITLLRKRDNAGLEDWRLQAKIRFARAPKFDPSTTMALTKNDPSGRRRIVPWYGRRFTIFLGLVAIFSICIPTEAGDILRPGVGPAFTGAPGSAIGTTPTSTSAQVRADAQ